MNYKVLIADDEESSIVILAELIKSFHNYLVVEKIKDPSLLIRSTIENKPDLLLLDINFGEKYGIDIAKEVKSINNDIEIIFVTAYKDFALDAFNCKACDYLLKPVSITRLSNALKHFEEHIQSKHTISSNSISEPIRFNTQQGFILVKPEEVVCLEADQVYTSIRTTDNKVHHVSQNIGKIEKLLNPQNFIRVSRSSIVNEQFISEISRTKKKCTLRWNGDIYNISISKSGIDKLDQKFL